MPKDFIPIEEPIIELKERMEELKESTDSGKKAEYEELLKIFEKKWNEIAEKLTPWEITQLARHPLRPYTLDYVKLIFEDFVEIHGDRRFADDKAIIAGLAFYKKNSLVVIGHQKGRTTREKIERNFGMANPEGYRKALRVMKLGEKFGLPVISFVDTPGAYPGIGAEERGQAEAIAYNLREMARLKVPIIVIIIGEGGSGGALGIGVGDRVYMLEYSIYSVISPEGCAAILWKNQSAVEESAKNLKLTAKDLIALGVIDEIIPEPVGGAHSNYEETAFSISKYIEKGLKELKKLSPEVLVKRRIEKFRKMGVFEII
ncbi:MAG: acetyl-CoA carboxylase carboxyltransferase subunit alpha [Candidatus Aminicenantia bacterium]